MPQDFSHQNLRGRSFRGQNLEGVNFSYADIRSADFTGANLRGANFSHAQAGLQKRWAIFLVCVSWLISGLSGFLSLFVVPLIMQIFGRANVEGQFIGGWATLIVMIVFFLVTIRKGIRAGLGVIAVVIAVAGAFAFTGAFPDVINISGTFAFAGAIAFTFIGALAIAVAFAVAFAVAGDIVGFVVGAIAVVFAVAFAVIKAKNFAVSFSLTGAVVGAIALFDIYIGWRAMKEDEKYSLVRNIAIVFATTGGTSFYNADLTDADFQGAILKSTDFKKATLIRTHWQDVKKLDLVRPGLTYLKSTQVRQLLVTKQGKDRNYDHLNLRGINLQKANLQDASFISTDLDEANLQDADLSRTKLKQTQLDKTDFTGATLTGAYIEDWGITSNTKFNGVRCEYVYMRLPTKENPDPWRKPDNREEVFEDGEFGDFIKPLVDTLDLYHSQGVDPRAIGIAFKQLVENNPNAELRIVGMEVRGEDKFLLRAKTAPSANKSELSAEYFESYNHLKGLPSSEQIKHFLTELKVKDSQINLQQNHIYRLENMISTALERPSLQAQKIYNQGNIMSQSPKKKSHFDLKGAQFAGGLVNADTVNADQIGGDITNYDQQQQKEAQTETNNSAVKTILILAANPKNTSQLRLDEEIREIDAGLQRAKKRELFDLKQRWAVRVQDVYQALLDFKPQIVHFSGHGSGDDGLALEDEAGKLKLVDTEALAKLFELFSTTIECIGY